MKPSFIRLLLHAAFRITPFPQQWTYKLRNLHRKHKLMQQTPTSHKKQNKLLADASAYVTEIAQPKNGQSTKFIINCAARTGSTMLVHLLRANTQILCHGEIFGGKELGNIWGKYRQLRREDQKFDLALHEMATHDPETFIKKVVFDDQERQAVGFKYKTDESLGDWINTTTKIIASNHNIKVINLIRRDLLDQFISHHVVASQTGITLAHKTEDIPEVQRFKINANHVLNYLIDVKEREKCSLDMYKDHELYTVYYEDLVTNNQEVHFRLQEFLGVTPTELHTTTKKLIQDNKMLLINRAEVVQHLRENGFGERISNENFV